MTSRPTIILSSDAQRLRAKAYVDRCPTYAVVEFKESKRTLPQNARLHAMLTELADAIDWHGQKLSVADWKLLFMDALNRDMRMVPAINGNGFVQLGRRTSKTTVEECGDLMTLIEAFAAERGVMLGEKV